MASHAPRSLSVRSAVVDLRTARSRTRWPVRTTLLAAIAGVAVVLLGTTPAHAEPSVTEIEKQIDVAWNQLEPIIEKDNATRQDLAARKKQADELAKKIQPLQLQVDMAMGRVTEMAVRAYKGDNTSAINAILTTDSPTMLADQLTILDQFARRQEHDVQAVVDLKEKYAAEKAPLDTLVAQLTKTEADLAAKKKQIDAEIDRLQKLRLQVYGNGGGGPLRPAPCPSNYPGGAAGIAVKYACAQIGKMYVWGAAGPNTFDCSGLMLAAWAKAGVTLPHNAAAQRKVTAYVKRADLRPGDLVFYYADLHHVGMYVGDGWVVHASQAGEPVKMKPIDQGTIHSFGRPG